MTTIARCPRCRQDHDRSARCIPSDRVCRDTHRDHHCILHIGHIGPHWGPATLNPDHYHEWRSR